jgi:toluene monooxygenase system ferredoxin subunit
MTPSMTLRRAMALDDLWAGELTPIRIDGTKVLLVRFEDEVFAYADRCAHLGVELSRGRLEGRTLTCYAHEWSYDVVTGCGINPKAACLTRFAVEVVDGVVLVDVSDGGNREGRNI